MRASRATIEAVYSGTAARGAMVGQRIMAASAAGVPSSMRERLLVEFLGAGARAHRGGWAPTMLCSSSASRNSRIRRRHAAPR